MGFASRIRFVLRRGAELCPITALGFLVVAVSAAGFYFFGVLAMDYVLLVMSGVLGALVLVEAVVVALSAVVLALRLRRVPPAENAAAVETLTWVETGFAAPTRSLPTLRKSWVWLSHPRVRVASAGKRLGVEHERARFDRRGVYENIERRFVVEDVLGLARVSLRHRTPGALRVLPKALGLRKASTILSLAGGEDLPHPLGTLDGDRMDIRRYASGDPARFIHWKIYGRTRKLMVRMHERALTRTERIAAFLVAGPGDEASAAAARVAVESGALGEGYRFGASGDGRAVDSAEAARELIVRSAAFDGDGLRGFAEFLARVDREGPVSVLLFVPPAPGPWLDGVLRELGARKHRTRVVIAVDAVDASGAGPGVLTRALWRPSRWTKPNEARVSGDALRQVLGVLGKHHVPALVLDRPEGREWRQGMTPEALRRERAA
jgi:uncharacterized protein (DUF58 family)